MVRRNAIELSNKKNDIPDTAETVLVPWMSVLAGVEVEENNLNFLYLSLSVSVNHHFGEQKHFIW